MKGLIACIVAGFLLTSVSLAAPQGAAGERPASPSPSSEPPAVLVDREYMRYFQLDINQSDIKSFRESLNLSEQQSSAVSDLFTAYRRLMTSAASKMQSALIAASKAPGVMEQRSGAWRQQLEAKFQAHREKLRVQLLDDIRGLLTPEQGAGWNEVERRVRRRLVTAQLFGLAESVDVTALVEEAMRPAPVAPDVRAALDRYEIEIDQAFRSLDAAMRENSAEKAKLGNRYAEMSAEELDAQLATQQARLATGRKLAGEINMRTVKKIGPMLDEQPRYKFFGAFYVVGFRFFDGASPGAMDRALEQAESLEGITPKQLDEIRAIKMKFRAERIAWAQRNAEQAWNKSQESTETNSSFMVDHARVSTERVEIDRRTIQALRDAIGEERVDQLGDMFKRFVPPVVEFEE